MLTGNRFDTTIRRRRTRRDDEAAEEEEEDEDDDVDVELEHTSSQMPLLSTLFTLASALIVQESDDYYRSSLAFQEVPRRRGWVICVCADNVVTDRK